MLYDPYAPMPTGLPRPVWDAPDGKLRPVPWSQESRRWGKIDEMTRGMNATAHGLCLVCGEHVDSGYVFVSEPEARVYGIERPAVFTREHLGLNMVSDYAPLHDTCVRLTRAHCRAIREFIADGTVTIAPYRDEA